MNLMSSKIRSPEKGTWSLACAKHCYLSGSEYNSPYQKIPANTGMTAEQAVYQFVVGEKNDWWADYAPWPSNAPCAY